MTEVIKEKLYFSTDKKKAEYLLEIINQKIKHDHNFIEYVNQKGKKLEEITDSAKWRFTGEYLSKIREWSIKTGYLYIFFNNSAQNNNETQVEYSKIKDLILKYCPDFIQSLESGKDTPIGVLKSKLGKRGPKEKEIEGLLDIQNSSYNH